MLSYVIKNVDRGMGLRYKTQGDYRVHYTSIKHGYSQNTHNIAELLYQ